MGGEKRVEVVRHSNDAAISPPVTLHGTGGKQLELSSFEVLHLLEVFFGHKRAETTFVK